MFPFDDAAAALAGIAIIACGYVVFGLTGFGASLFTIPVLTHFYPLPFVLVLAGLLDLAAAMVIGFRDRRRAAVQELRWLVPFSVLGAVVGVSLLMSLPRKASLLALGVFIGGYGLHQCLRRREPAPASQAWAPLAGMLGGATGTLFGMGGPAYLVYLTRRVTDKGSLRATMTVMVWFNLVIRLLVFAVAGMLFQSGLLLALLWFLPASLGGLWLGNRWHRGIENARLLRVLYGLLVVCGLSLIARAAWA